MLTKLFFLFAVLAFVAAKPTHLGGYGYNSGYNNGYNNGWNGYGGYSGYSGYSPLSYGGYGSYGSYNYPYNSGYGIW